MSVYSGFATRLLESKYNRLVYTVITILSSKLREFEAQLQKDKAWMHMIHKAYIKLRKLEEYKYLEPKFSTSLSSIVDLPKITIENLKIKPIEIAPSTSKNANIMKQLDSDETITHYSIENKKIIPNMLDRLFVKERARNLSNLRLNPLDSTSQKIIRNKLPPKRRLTPHREGKKLLYYLNTSLLHI